MGKPHKVDALMIDCEHKCIHVRYYIICCRSSDIRKYRRQQAEAGIVLQDQHSSIIHVHVSHLTEEDIRLNKEKTLKLQREQVEEKKKVIGYYGNSIGLNL